MRKPSSVLAALVLLAGGATLVRGDDETARAIIARAIKAEGGAERLAKIKAGIAKSKGTLELLGNRINLTSEDYFQLPNRIKNVVTLEVLNMTVTVTTVFNQDKLWIQAQGQTQELKDPNLLAELKHQLYLGKVGLLFPLTEPGCQLSSLEEIQIAGRPAVGVGIVAQGQRDVKMYFDKKTGLTVKLETRAYDSQTRKEVNQEKFYSDFRLVDGVHVPRKVVVHQDGKQFMEIEITEFRLLEKLDDAIFARP